MRKIYKVAYGLLVTSLAGTVVAQPDYPSRSIRMIIPYAAGGGTDVMARKVAQQMSDILKQPIVADNKPGAGTVVAAKELAKSAPDGYTVMWGDNATFVVNPLLFKNPPYDPVKDFAPIGVTLKGGLVLSVNASIPATNVKEFIAYAKSNPEKLSYGTPGNGTPHHLMMEAFKKAAGGLKIVHAPYKGEGPAITDLAGGNLQTMFSGARVAVATAANGRIRPLAFSGQERNKAAPDVPTFGEAGFPGFVNEYWHGLAAPAGTPAAVIAKLNAVMKQAMQDPELQAWMAAGSGTRSVASTPEEMSERMIKETRTSRELVHSLNMELN